MFLAPVFHAHRDHWPSQEAQSGSLEPLPRCRRRRRRARASATRTWCEEGGCSGAVRPDETAPTALSLSLSLSLSPGSREPRKPVPAAARQGRGSGGGRPGRRGGIFGEVWAQL